MITTQDNNRTYLAAQEATDIVITDSMSQLDACTLTVNGVDYPIYPTETGGVQTLTIPLREILSGLPCLDPPTPGSHAPIQATPDITCAITLTDERGSTVYTRTFYAHYGYPYGVLEWPTLFSGRKEIYADDPMPVSFLPTIDLAEQESSEGFSIQIKIVKTDGTVLPFAEKMVLEDMDKYCLDVIDETPIYWIHEYDLSLSLVDVKSIALRFERDNLIGHSYELEYVLRGVRPKNVHQFTFRTSRGGVDYIYNRGEFRHVPEFEYDSWISRLISRQTRTRETQSFEVNTGRFASDNERRQWLDLFRSDCIWIDGQRIVLDEVQTEDTVGTTASATFRFHLEQFNPVTTL